MANGKADLITSSARLIKNSGPWIVAILMAFGWAYETFGRDIVTGDRATQTEVESMFERHITVDETEQTRKLMDYVDQRLEQHRKSGHSTTREDVVKVSAQINEMSKQLDRIEQRLMEQERKR